MPAAYRPSRVPRLTPASTRLVAGLGLLGVLAGVSLGTLLGR